MRKQLLFLCLLCAFTPLFAQPVITVLSGTTTFCNGGQVVLRSNVTHGIRWYRNGTATASTSQDFTATSGGDYTVKTLTGTTSNTITVTVNPTPTSAIAPSGTNGVIYICAGSSQTLAASNAGVGGSYLWNTGATTQSINVSTSGDYWVTVTNAFGCSTKSPKKTVNVAPAVTPATITSSGSTGICSGSSVQLTSSAAAGYQWYRNNIIISGATSQSYVASAAGNYSVRISNGTCMSAHSNYLNVTVYGLPNASISPAGSVTMCAGGTTTLTSSTAGIGGSYLWSTGETTQSITVSSPGSYTVTVTNFRGCSRTSAATVVNNYPAATVDAGNDTTILYGYGVQTAELEATATGDGPFDFMWSTNETTADITVSPIITTSYIVAATDTHGCRVMDTVVVNVTDIRCSSDSDKVFMCHMDPGSSAYTICVSSDAVPTHLAHGDELGECSINSTARFAGSASGEHGIHTAERLIVYPNPFNETLQLTYSLDNEKQVVIEVFNVIGEKVKTITNSRQEEGEHQFILNMKNESMTDGVYYIRFTDGEQSYTQRVVRTSH